MFHYSDQVSSDLIWEIVRPQNSYLIKRPSSGGVQFSRDPLNLKNIHSRKYAGFVNEKAIGIIPIDNDKGGVTIIAKKPKNAQRPSSSISKTTLGSNKTARKTYKSIANLTARSGYRADLRIEAVSRASAIRYSKKPKKDAPEKKVRGANAKKSNAVKEE